MRELFGKIRERVAEKDFQISAHAEQEREAEEILLSDLVYAVIHGELLEDYPEDKRGHSCLVLGFTKSGQAIHSVWTILENGRARLITVYLPQPPKWINPRTRRASTTE
jgi:hypothetical protein